jgi:hypothetical protein
MHLLARLGVKSVAPVFAATLACAAAPAAGDGIGTSIATRSPPEPATTSGSDSCVCRRA